MHRVELHVDFSLKLTNFFKGLHHIAKRVNVFDFFR